MNNFFNDYKPQRSGKRGTRKGGLKTNTPSDVRSSAKPVKGAVARAGVKSRMAHRPAMRIDYSGDVPVLEFPFRGGGASSPVEELKNQQSLRTWSPILYVPPIGGYHIDPPEHLRGKCERVTRTIWESLHFGNRPRKPASLKYSAEALRYARRHPEQVFSLPAGMPHLSDLIATFGQSAII